MSKSSFFVNIPDQLKKDLHIFALEHDTSMTEITILALKSYIYDKEEIKDNDDETALFEGGK